ncbi:hypothetical protein HNQ60_002079 [Povalibacter uvarum]|uniref:DUF1579 domain-containing protein n=1 Tax=Povalibacter uvarum TaxID=732238 RepID=A0A841HJ14_9GAMM|nr:twin-arginine translocation signal domain-containing protein [Povalibacter uvarum]MBB6093201.1 hypothetical protein [Povalibacter uvarum]
MQHESPACLTRRHFITRATLAGSALAIGIPVFAGPVDHSRDWRWLVGNWDVFHRRLKDRLVGSNEWEEFGGKSALWLTLNGLGTIDDNIVELPGGTYRGVTLRAFDPATGKWSIWWIDGRDPTSIDVPVVGGFEGDHGTFLGRDVLKGRPIVMRFRWQDIHSSRPWWEQAFSTDEGATWEVNWRNYFTRTASTPTPLPSLADAPKDFDFLVGRWKVRHRKLKQRFANSGEWETCDGTFVNWPVLGGHANVGDNAMEFPSGTVRGIGFRTFDAASRQWSSWWLDGRNPSVIGSPVRGGFSNGVGTFMGEEMSQGRRVQTRVLWTHTSHSARWEQSGSVDGGVTWETNWVSDYTR